jgi:hypothetical protein
VSKAEVFICSIRDDKVPVEKIRVRTQAQSVGGVGKRGSKGRLIREPARGQNGCQSVGKRASSSAKKGGFTASARSMKNEREEAGARRAEKESSERARERTERRQLDNSIRGYRMSLYTR